MSRPAAAAVGPRGDDDVPVEQVADLLLSLSRAKRWLSRLATDEPAAVGASGISALAEVVRNGPIRLGDLAARLRRLSPGDRAALLDAGPALRRLLVEQ